MKFTISIKVFATLVGVSISLSAALFALFQWSFDRGFYEYANRYEESRLLRLQQLVEQYYQRKQSFAELAYNANAWPEMIFHTENKQGNVAVINSMELTLSSSVDDKQYFPTGKRFEDRVGLFNKEKKLLSGPSFVVFNQFVPIVYQNNTVAYIGYNPPAVLSSVRDAVFVEQIQGSFITILVFVNLVTGLVAIPFSLRLVRPVRRLRDVTRRLISGNYESLPKETRGDELGQLGRDLEILAKTLKDNQQSHQRWIADISHELRTPMTIINGEIEAMLDGIRELNHENLLALRQESAHIQSLIDDLREISLADAGALSYEMQRCDLMLIVQSTIQSLTPQIVAKPLTLHRHLSKKPAWVMADEKRLRQLLVNVLSNSIRYTDKQGQIDVRYRHAEPKQHILCIEDSAPSVAEDELPKLFQRFYRVESSRNRQSGGSGLGLSICEQIVDAHNGSIRAYQSPLGGLGIEIIMNEAI